ncbi:MAG: DNA-binding transcriptional regulator Fis [Gammaproteobacteria bacterium]|nr:DNA-binding transcriptional regulator Fis [Gammaproteobacteria bacterium]
MPAHIHQNNDNPNPAAATADTEAAATEANPNPLRACVKTMMEDYFNDMAGHQIGDIYEMVLNEVEQPLLASVMQYTRGNQSKAAELLGINRGTLRKKLKKHDLD